MIELGILRIDLDKVKIVEKQLILEKLKDIKGFLGFTNFYRSLIKGYGSIIKSLTNLTRKEEGIKQDLVQEKAFRYLKKVITDKLMVVLVNPDVLFEIEVDVSKDVIRIILI